MKNHYKFAGFVFVMLFLFSLSPASAQVTFTDNEAAFFARNPNLAVQDFESGNVPPGLAQECFASTLNENSNITNNACFSPGDILPGIEFFTTAEFVIAGPGFSSNPFIALLPDLRGDFDITFPGNTVNAVGLDLGCLVDDQGGPCSDTVRVRVFGIGDALIGFKSVVVSDLFDSFLGIQSAVPITRINVSNNPQGDFEGIDRISFGLAEPNVIPTLSEWGMIAAAAGLMLVGVFFALRRRRHTGAAE